MSQPDADLAPAPSLADEAAARTAAQATRLLLVDDEPSVLSALRRLFRMQGYATEQAGSGAEGLKLLRQQPFDLVISDMRMPEMDGAAFLEQVRRHNADTVRILLTGYSDIGSTVAAINRGEIHRYIAKPWDDHDLLLVVSEALNKRALQAQNRLLQQLTQQQNEQLQTLNATLEQRVAERTDELAQANARLGETLQALQANFTMAVTVFSGLLEMRRDGIAGHARRVADLAQRMAVKLDLDEEAQREVYLAAMLHDIGKIGFPDSMLGKPVSDFDAEEMQRYREHPLQGEAALLPMDRLRGVAAIVRQHHERLDGRGFPDGLYGPAIGLGAKIVSAASDYDGLTSGNLAERQYTPDLARQALREGIGKHYDERVVRVLFEALSDIDAEAKADVELEITQIKPRMVLSRDMVSQSGAVVLPKGFRFDSRVIAKMTEFSARTSARMSVWVLRKSIEPAAAPTSPASAPRSGAPS